MRNEFSAKLEKNIGSDLIKLESIISYLFIVLFCYCQIEIRREGDEIGVGTYGMGVGGSINSRLLNRDMTKSSC